MKPISVIVTKYLLPADSQELQHMAIQQQLYGLGELRRVVHGRFILWICIQWKSSMPNLRVTEFP